MIAASRSAKRPKVMFDEELRWNDHIPLAVKRATATVLSLSRRRYVRPAQMRHVDQACVLLKLDWITCRQSGTSQSATKRICITLPQYKKRTSSRSFRHSEGYKFSCAKPQCYCDLYAAFHMRVESAGLQRATPSPRSLYVPAYSFYAVHKCCSAASSGQSASDRISRGLLTVVGPGKYPSVSRKQRLPVTEKMSHAENA